MTESDPDDRPVLTLAKVREVRPKHLAYRFLAGALTSVAAGGVSLLFGARTGGVLLAFPAILAASVTLIENKEEHSDAREDARGAILGAGALLTFAIVGVLTLDDLTSGLALLVATAAWLVVALGGYLLLWWR
jgi:hypothetical protein